MPTLISVWTWACLSTLACVATPVSTHAHVYAHVHVDVATLPSISPGSGGALGSHGRALGAEDPGPAVGVPVSNGGVANLSSELHFP
eukprot:4950574-Alexandrium_andersonii.AAC.1